MTPVTLAIASELGVDPRPLVIALMIGASACFATPIGYQTNTIVYAAGDYRGAAQYHHRGFDLPRDHLLHNLTA